MKAHRTPWWYYLIAIVCGLIGGALLAKYDEATGFALIGVPWFISALLLLIGVSVLIMALQVHKYATTDPRKRAALKPLDPQKAVSTLVLAKSLGLVGAALAGWYGGQILMIIDHAEAQYYAQVILECAIACVVCVADMVIGIVGEWLCQLPPMDGPESAKMKEAARRQRGIAPAAVKSRP
ncbi:MULTISPECIES: DUF3180 domain-containing protein [Bifidobacterium]|uniref:DUF3180 domain-containing protein n=1 Tax=Bifidobacterium TaxID=1678 RepID=UPI001BDC2B96|nr:MULTISPECIES: DUF3180 domain-containing protein [Bifidobacterium]MBT1162072.1 DUF3180 domain-containing protein [Bifidobacterium sp. SO1]MBW3078005.1 DUF3180 domain-containing protein [Bifidobacterium simiiventris]